MNSTLKFASLNPFKGRGKRGGFLTATKKDVARTLGAAYRHKGRVGMGIVGAGTAAMAANKYNNYAGVDNPEERKRNIGRGVLAGTAIGAIAGPKAPGRVIRGAVKANRGLRNIGRRIGGALG